ncbi:MAG TPA: hypothetical protein VGM51_09880 [Armatimonadota bacterium]|jgi:hypothetical protein
MVELHPSPVLASAFTVDVDDALQIRELTHHVAHHVGAEACAALREFLANVREHCTRKDVQIVELPSLLVAYDHGGGIVDYHSHKPDGEGGYGISIMRALGADLRGWEEGTMFVMVV